MADDIKDIKEDIEEAATEEASEISEKINEEVHEFSDDIVDQEEYEKALKVLESGKGKRVKEKKEKEKEEKKAAVKASGKKTFIGECRKKPMIPACIFLAVAVVIGAILYFAIPAIALNSFDFTPEQMAEKYSQTEIYNNSLSAYNFAIPPVTYDTSGEEGAGQSSRYTGFSASISNTATTFGTALTGTVRNYDGKVTSLRVMAEYSSSSDYYEFLLVYFGSYLQTVYPDMNSEEAFDAVEAALAGINDATFDVRGEYAYDISIITSEDGQGIIVLDLIPAEELS